MSSSSIHAEGPSETTVVVKSMGRWAKLSSVHTCFLACCCAEFKYDLFCKNVKVILPPVGSFYREGPWPPLACIISSAL